MGRSEPQSNCFPGNWTIGEGVCEFWIGLVYGGEVRFSSTEAAVKGSPFTDLGRVARGKDGKMVRWRPSPFRVQYMPERMRHLPPPGLPAVRGHRLGLGFRQVDREGEGSGSAVPARDCYLVGSQWFQGMSPRATFPLESLWNAKWAANGNSFLRELMIGGQKDSWSPACPKSVVWGKE